MWFPLPKDFPDPVFEPTSPVSPALTSGFFTTEPPENCIESLIIIKTARAFHLCLSQQVLDIIAMWMEIIAYAKGLEEQKDLPDD